MTSRSWWRPALAGTAAVTLYLAAVVVTLRWSGHPVRPYYEGVGNNVPYRWVKPPREFAPGNVVPKPTGSELAIGAGGSLAAQFSSDDAQFNINMAAGVVPASAGDTTATVTITPLDPATLPAVPAGVRADGNGYRLAITLRPSGRALSALAGQATVLMTVPEPASDVLVSTDGRTWRSAASSPVTGNPLQRSFTLVSTGEYLAVASGSGPAVTTTGGGGGSLLGPLFFAVALVPFLLLVPVLVRRRRRSR